VIAQRALGRRAHVGVRLDRQHLRPGVEQEAGEDPGAGAEIADDGAIDQAVLAEQIDRLCRVGRARPGVVVGAPGEAVGRIDPRHRVSVRRG
jgi:hypothetical protein